MSNELLDQQIEKELKALSELEILTKQPMPLTVNGKEYMISPLTFNEWAELRLWVKGDKLKRFREMVKDLSPQGRIEVEKKFWSEIQFNDISMYTHVAEAVLEWIFVSIRINDPEITRDELKSWNNVAFNKALGLIYVVNDLLTWVEDDSSKKNDTVAPN